MIVSIAIAGAAFGSIFAGPFSDLLGRKYGTLLADLFCTVGALVMGLAKTIEVIAVGRFIVGLGVGIASSVVPIFLAEIAPTAARGRVVTTSQLSITLG